MPSTLAISEKTVDFIKAPSMDFLSKIIKLSSLRREKCSLRGGYAASLSLTQCLLLLEAINLLTTVVERQIDLVGKSGKL